jgi:hypothetical protein
MEKNPPMHLSGKGSKQGIMRQVVQKRYVVTRSRCAILDGKGNTKVEVIYAKPFELQLGYNRGLSDSSEGGFFTSDGGEKSRSTRMNDLQSAGSLYFLRHGSSIMVFPHVGNPDVVRRFILQLAEEYGKASTG